MYLQLVANLKGARLFDERVVRMNTAVDSIVYIFVIKKKLRICRST